MRIAAAFYIETEKKYTFPLSFFLLTVFTAISMIVSKVFARMGRKRTSPVQANNITNHHKTNMIISNLIPFTTLNYIYALDLIVNAIVKLFNPTQMGLPKLSIHVSVMLLLLVLSNSEAKRHFKRKVAAGRGRDLVEVVELHQQPTQRGQPTNPQQSRKTHLPNLPNQTYQETTN